MNLNVWLLHVVFMFLHVDKDNERDHVKLCT